MILPTDFTQADADEARCLIARAAWLDDLHRECCAEMTRYFRQERSAPVQLVTFWEWAQGWRIWCDSPCAGMVEGAD